MLVDTPFELFTTLIGWLMYDTFWDILIGTGLIHLSFLVILLTSVVDAAPKGDEGGVHAYKSVTLGMGIAMVVLLLAAQPMMSLPPSAVKFAKPCADAGAVSAEDSGTTFDRNFDTYVQTVQVPIWWAMIMRFSYGLNNAAKAAVPCPVDLRLAMSSFALAEMGSPDLTTNVARFAEECFLPALATYRRIGVTPAIEAVTDVYGEHDPEWMGSRVYTEVHGFYDDMYATRPVVGWPFDPSARGTDRYSADMATRQRISPPAFGQPSCQEWWVTTLRPQLLDAAMNPLIEAAYGGTLTFVQQEKIIHSMIAKHSLQTGGYRQDADVSTATGWSWAGEKLNNITATLGLTNQQPTQETEFTVIREAIPFVKSVLLLVVVLTLPFLYILGNFSLTTLATATVGYMVINFTAFFWHLAWVMDNQLVATFFPDIGDMFWSNIGFGNDDVKFKVMNFLVPMLYIMMPMAYLTIVGWAGYHVISAHDLTSSARIAGAGATGVTKSIQKSAVGGARSGGAQVADTAATHAVSGRSARRF